MPNCYAALDDILSLARLDPLSRDQVQISGTDPVLPTNFLSVRRAQPWCQPPDLRLQISGSCGPAANRRFRQMFVARAWPCEVTALFTGMVKRLVAGILCPASMRRRVAVGFNFIATIPITGRGRWNSSVPRKPENLLPRRLQNGTQ